LIHANTLLEEHFVLQGRIDGNPSMSTHLLAAGLLLIMATGLIEPEP